MFYNKKKIKNKMKVTHLQLLLQFSLKETSPTNIKQIFIDSVSQNTSNNMGRKIDSKLFDYRASFCVTPGTLAQ